LKATRAALFGQRAKILELQNQLENLEEIKKTWDTKEHRTAVENARKMSIHDMLDWADRAAEGIQRALDDYRFDANPVSLVELKTAVTGLQALVERLEAKHGRLE
jgi:hypothetical protein